MAYDDDRRIDRLAKRAKELDDVIVKAAKMQKRIVEEIQRIGVRDRFRTQRMSPSTKARSSRKRRA